MNQNTNNLIVVDFDPTQNNIYYLKYFIQNQEKNIMSYFHGTAQQAIKVSDLNNSLFSQNFNIKFRRSKKDENLKGKLCFNRVGKFGVDIHD